MTVLDADLGKVHSFIHLRATIDQVLDLHDFPFDQQKLVFRLQSEYPSTCMEFRKFTDRDPKIFAGATSEWQFRHPTLPDIKLINPVFPNAIGMTTYACITTEFYARRKPEWYIWNTVLISFVIVLSSFSIFFVDADAKADRLSVLFT